MWQKLEEGRQTKTTLNMQELSTLQQQRGFFVKVFSRQGLKPEWMKIMQNVFKFHGYIFTEVNYNVEGWHSPWWALWLAIGYSRIKPFSTSGLRELDLARDGL